MARVESSPYVWTDLHSHNHFSPDSVAKPEQIVRRCKDTGIRGLAITNHNTISGIEETKEAAHELGVNLLVIPGEEVTTTDCNSEDKPIELLVFFPQEEITPPVSIDEMLRAVKSQGALLGIPHPFEEWRHGAGENAVSIIERAKGLGIPTILEAYNSRAGSGNNRRAEDFLKTRNDRHGDGLLTGVGSDAHYWREIGRTKLLYLRPWETKEEFLKNLQEASQWVRRYPLDYRQRLVFITSGYRTLNRASFLPRHVSKFLAKFYS